MDADPASLTVVQIHSCDLAILDFPTIIRTGNPAGQAIYAGLRIPDRDLGSPGAGFKLL
jgi:hypothetical protein